MFAQIVGGNLYSRSPVCPECHRIMVTEDMVDQIKEVRQHIEEITGKEVGKHRKSEIL